MPMNCRQYRASLIDLARSAGSNPPRPSALAAHLDVCAECSRFRNVQLALQSAIASLAAEPALAPPSEDLEARVLAEFDAAARSALPSVRWRFPAAVAALAAALVVAAVLIHRPPPAPLPAEAPHRLSDEPFVAIPYVAPPAPYERTEVVRMDVPAAALVAAGFEVHLLDYGAAVRADLLIGQDGRALAIRLIPSSVPNPDRSLKQ